MKIKTIITFILSFIISLYTSSIVFAEENIQPYKVPGGYIYYDAATGTITDADINITSAVIPSTINGTTITAIDSMAFDTCWDVLSIEIPETVTYIGDYAFQHCSCITEITLPQGIKSIEKGTFSNCSSLEKINMPAEL